MATPRSRRRLRNRARAPEVDFSDLAKSDTCRRLTLRRAERGGLSAHDELIVDHGRQLPGPLAVAAHDLIRDGLLALSNQPNGSVPRVELTSRGRAELTCLHAEHERKLVALRDVSDTPAPAEIRLPTVDLMTPLALILIIVCGLAFIALLIRNLFDRPSPLGTDAEQGERHVATDTDQLGALRAALNERRELQ